MKSAIYAMTAIAAITLAAPALAQADPANGTAATDTMGAPQQAHSHMMRAKTQPAKSPGGYSGVDTAGKREEVKAPYGGHDQAQADAKEAPVTDRLNQMELQGNGPHN